MLFRMQFIIDSFDDQFRHTLDGALVFQPMDEFDVAVPVTTQEYQEALSAFERLHIRNNVLNLLLVGAAGVYGVYRFITGASFLPFVLAVLLAGFVSTLLHLRGTLGPVAHLRKRRNALIEASYGEAGDEAAT